MKNIYYIFNRECKKISSFKELGCIILKEEYKVEEVIRGPSWNPAIYFYLLRGETKCLKA